MKKAFPILGVFFLMLTAAILFSPRAQAACNHTLESVYYSEAAHPHEYFKYCTTCHEKVYIGGHATKAHGDGSWGSGTCPDCGSHSYTGRTCTTGGTCACGATIGSLGHSLDSVTYSEAAHPHYYFRYCRRCGDEIYTGGQETKKHGAGVSGSGTCPDCGTCTFVGATCTTGGTCACGKTCNALGHSYEISLHYDSNHPHKEYQFCYRCQRKNYTGNTSTRPHGDGTNGTCRLCGSHEYKLDSSTPAAHPHKMVGICSCGATSTSYPIIFTCTTCKTNLRTTTGTSATNGVFTYFDGGNTLGALISCPVTYHIDYTNEHNYPNQDLVTPSLQGPNYPEFASFGSIAKSYADNYPNWASPMITAVAQEATYYDEDGEVLYTQSMEWFGIEAHIRSKAEVIALSTKPAYVEVQGTCMIKEALYPVIGKTRTYFP